MHKHKAVPCFLLGLCAKMTKESETEKSFKIGCVVLDPEEEVNLESRLFKVNF